MKEEKDFLKTITLLMRLTREGKIAWEDASLPATLTALGSMQSQKFKTELADMRFYLERVPASLGMGNLMQHAVEQYRLIVEDPSASSPISSPPMKAAKDLVSVIHSVEKRQSEALRKRLAKINERLEAAS